ncbi:MAG: glycosyltransferase family 4 protein [Pseudomonadota bacterium]
MTDPAWPHLNGQTILQVIPDLSAGGAERTTIEVAEAITRAGGRAVVASEGGRMETTLGRAGGKLIRLPLTSKNPLTVWRNVARLREVIEAERVKLVHARSRAPAWSAYLAARRTGTPFITTYHGIYSGTMGPKKYYNSVMARGDFVIANSNWTASHVAALHGLAPNRIVTIPRGVDLTIFDPGRIKGEQLSELAQKWNIADDDDRLVVVLAGRLTAWKGQLLAIEAFGRLSSEEKDGIHLILVGDPQGRQSYVDRIEQAIVDNGLGGAVSIVGHCDEMPVAYRLADVVLAPSQRPEAFGRVAAEASAMARPVIVSDHGGQQETVIDGETGVRVTAGSREALAGALRTLFQMPPSARRAMGEAGRAFVRENYSIEKLQHATLDVYAARLNDPELSQQIG